MFPYGRVVAWELLLLAAACYVVCLTISEPYTVIEFLNPGPEINPSLQQFQDAWKTLGEGETYILMRRTSGNSSESATRVCLHSQVVFKRKGIYERSLKQSLTYYDTVEKKAVRRMVSAELYPHYGYNVTNVMNITEGEGYKRGLHAILYSDYGKCYVTINRRHRGCELWVNRRYEDDYPSACDFVFGLSCREGNIEVYRKEPCQFFFNSIESQSDFTEFNTWSTNATTLENQILQWE